MITQTTPEVNIRPSYLASLLHERNSIRALAIQLVAGQVEAHIDMISDAGAKEYSTYGEVADCIAGAKETVLDYVEDLLTEFRDMLHEEIAKVKIDTKAVMLKRDDEIDAEVNVWSE